MALFIILLRLFLQTSTQYDLYGTVNNIGCVVTCDPECVLSFQSLASLLVRDHTRKCNLINLLTSSFSGFGLNLIRSCVKVEGSSSFSTMFSITAPNNGAFFLIEICRHAAYICAYIYSLGGDTGGVVV